MTAEDLARSTLLTEAEVAVRLRCHPSKIKRLRRNGKLAYIPGRPIFIRESDLADYLERAVKKANPGPAPGSPEAEAKAIEAIKQLARIKWMQRHLKDMR